MGQTCTKTDLNATSKIEQKPDIAKENRKSSPLP